MANVKNAAHAERYFTKEEDYYLSRDAREASLWWGHGAERLGLEGEVDRERFIGLVNGRLPDGTELNAKNGGTRRVGTDLTFSAPKSVSVEALVHGRDDVIEAHEAAVSEALRFLEERAANTRVCANNQVRRETTDNLVVARFEHHTSRALDPQLHTHCLTLNATQGQDGQWRALANDDLYRHKMAAGAVYRAELSCRLRALGYEVRVTHDDGRFELNGYSDEQLKGFSKRRAEIVAALEGELGQKLDSMGVSGAKAAKRANLGTRDRKTEVDQGVLRAAWRREADELGIQPLNRSAGDMQYPSHGARAAVDWAIEHLEERVAVYEEREVVRHALAHGVDANVSLGAVERVLEDRQREDELLKVGERREGQARYTSRQMLETEQRVIAMMRSGQGRYNRIREDDVEKDLDGRGLKAGQLAAARLILTNQDLVVGIQGYAGTGKTTMLRPVCELATAAGYEVQGLSVSAAAAKELQEGAGIASKTVASHLASKTAPEATKQRMWIVDEASFLSTKDARQLLSRAKAEGVKVVLVGDQEQLPSVEAGQPFAQLMKRGMPAAVMDEIVRQKNEVAREAVYETIRGKPTESLALLERNVVSEQDRDLRIAEVAQRYLERDAKETIVVTGSNRDRRALNDEIRRGLKADGRLTGPVTDGTVLVRKDLTQAQMRQSRSYAVDDIVRINRKGGYKRLGLEQDECVRVSGFDGTGGVIVAKEDGREVTWTPAQAARVEVYREERRSLMAGDKIRWTRNAKDMGRNNGETAEVLKVDGDNAAVRLSNGEVQPLRLTDERHWDHGYASTVHSAQGATADTVIAHINTEQQSLIGHEAWYVAISRARHEILVYTDDKDRLPASVQNLMAKESAMDRREEFVLEMSRTL